MPSTDPRLRTALPRGVVLRSPQLLAVYWQRGAAAAAAHYAGACVTKGITLQRLVGNPQPRMAKLEQGLLNSIGLKNDGAAAFAATELADLLAAPAGVIVNIAGDNASEFAHVVALLEVRRRELPGADDPGAGRGLLGYELNLSCPNVEHGTRFATDAALTREVVAACRRETDRLVVAKLSPNVTDIVPIAAAAQDAGADVVTLSNTVNAMAIDSKTRRSRLGRPHGGLSGAAVQPQVLYHVWQCRQQLPGLPVIASGGVANADSAIQYLLAGALAFQVCSGLFSNSELPAQIETGLLTYLDEHGAASVAEIVGTFAG